jgi:hypothetical protein
MGVNNGSAVLLRIKRDGRFPAKSLDLKLSVQHGARQMVSTRSTESGDKGDARQLLHFLHRVRLIKFQSGEAGKQLLHHTNKR